MRRFAAVGIPIVLALVLGGCSAFFPEDVTPTASASSSPEPAACSETAAQLTWHTQQEALPAVIGYRSVTVSPDGGQSTVDTELGYAATVTSDDLHSAAYFDTHWVNFLQDEFSRTGQAAAALGGATDYFDSAKPSDPPVGVTIIGYQLGQVQVGFDLQCAGQDLGSGWLTTIGGELHTTMIFCGDEFTEATTENEFYLQGLRTYCPAT
jgi:hypothetical protein